MGWHINELMPVNCAGFVTARDYFVIDFDRDMLLARISDLRDSRLKDGEIRAKYFAGNSSGKYPDGDTRGWKLPEARKRIESDQNWRDRITICLYRPFDWRYIFWTNWIVDWPRLEVMRHMSTADNLAMLWTRPMAPNFEFSVSCTRSFADQCSVGNKSAGAGITYEGPLYLQPAEEGELSFQNERFLNLSPTFLKALAEKLATPQIKSYYLPKGVMAEDILNYAYAVLHSPGYRSRYAEFLKIDFPRLPLTSSLELFRALAKLGGELVALHLMESPKLEKHITKFVGGKNDEVEKVTWSDETVWVDKDRSVGFNGVPEAVWNFHVGGYQVCEKWLKDRKGRKLSKDDIEHYQKIIVALSETIRLMGEIDKVIDAHGGWPKAFQQKQ